MSLHILNPQESEGGKIGAGLGQGISAGLQILLQDRMQKMQQKRQGDALEAAGLPRQLSQMDPAVASQVAKQTLQQQGIRELFGIGGAPSSGKKSASPFSMGERIQLKEGAPGEKVEEDVKVQEGAPPPLDAQGAQPTPPKRTIQDLSDEELSALIGMGGGIGQAAKDIKKDRREQQKLMARSQEKREERHSKISEKVLLRADEKAEELPQKEAALENMKNAIEQGNLSYFSPDNLAELTGIEAFRTPEGALFKTASKEFFLGSLKRAGARPNQWIEQQIQDMLTKIGRSRAANLTVTQALQADIDIERKALQLTREIADQLEKEHGYVTRQLGSEVQKQLKPYAEKRQRELEKKLKSIENTYGNKKSTSAGILMRDPAGNLRRVKKEDIKKAKAAGYKIE